MRHGLFAAACAGALALTGCPAERANDARPPGTSVRGLPLILLPVRHAERGVLAVFLSGDGGWVAVDREVSRILVDSGIPVVGWNSGTYFWNRRTPEEVAADLARVIRRYTAEWGIDRVVLAGYSRGADVLPFAANLLPTDLKARVPLLVLVSPETHTGFEFHLIDLFRDVRRPTDRPMLPELERLGWTGVLCFYGTEEKDTACPTLPDSIGTAVPVEGGHHLGGHYREVGERIVRTIDGR